MPIVKLTHPDIGRRGHFLKQIPDYFPAWVARVELPKRGGTVTH